VARNSDGKVLIAACSPLTGCRGAEDAEARSALLGIRLLEGHDKIIPESDCASPVNAIRSDEPDRSRLWHTYDQTKELLNTNRESNGVADKLAAAFG
jgi:hypothetical protein